MHTYSLHLCTFNKHYQNLALYVSIYLDDLAIEESTNVDDTDVVDTVFDPVTAKPVIDSNGKKIIFRVSS